MKSTLAAALFLFAPFAHASAVEYTLDSRHSNVHFSYVYGGSVPQVFAVHRPQATLQLDLGDLAASSLRAVVPIAGISTGLPEFDRKFQTAEYFDAANHPEAVFTSTRIEARGDKALRVEGELSLRGQSVPAVLEVDILHLERDPQAEPGEAAFSGSLRIDRSAFGLGMYGEYVGDAITITVHALFKPANASR
jgi:polyisoprenoid-binding protein YceI